MGLEGRMLNCGRRLAILGRPSASSGYFGALEGQTSLEDLRFSLPLEVVPGSEGPQQLVPSASSPSRVFWPVAAWCWHAIKGKRLLL